MSGIISYCGRADLADVEVVIREVCEPSADVTRKTRKRARDEQLALPGHRLVLCGASKVLEAQVRLEQL
jgi:hypothetical protein